MFGGSEIVLLFVFGHGVPDPFTMSVGILVSEMLEYQQNGTGSGNSKQDPIASTIAWGIVGFYYIQYLASQP